MSGLKVKKSGSFQAVGGATPTAWFENLPNLDHSTGFATATANASAHTKGSWVELVSSTAQITTALLVRVSDVRVTSTNSATLLDIGVGSSGSETAIISNVAVGGAQMLTFGSIFFVVPVNIASGSRVSARIQSVLTTPQTARVEVHAFNVGNADVIPTTVDVLGTNTATSEGTTMSGSIGAYVEVVASTSQAYQAVVIVPSTSSTYVNNDSGLTYTLAIGASGSETDIGKTTCGSSSSEVVYSELNGITSSLVGASIPAGSRLTIKHNISSAFSDYFDVTLIGVPYV